jgi:hypothetical protein
MSEKEVTLVSSTPEGGKVFVGASKEPPMTLETLKEKFRKHTQGRNLTPAMELIGDMLQFLEQRNDISSTGEVAPPL